MILHTKCAVLGDSLIFLKFWQHFNPVLMIFTEKNAIAIKFAFSYSLIPRMNDPWAQCIHIVIFVAILKKKFFFSLKDVVILLL